MMRWVIRILIGALGIAGVWRFLAAQRARKVSYPTPESYVVDPKLAEDRVIRLEGGINFRDLGGYTTAEGRTVRRGLIYRTGALTHLSQADWEIVQKLGIKLVCDLRSPEEVAEDPENLPDPNIQYAHLPLNVENENLKRLRTVLFNPQNIAGMLPESYTRIMIDQNPQVFGEVLRRLSNPDNLPAIVHCTAGKDRTGVTAALLLSLLGVPEEVIAADYTLSNYDFRHYHAYAAKALEPVAWLRVTADDLFPLLVANPETIKTLFVHIRTRYGSVEAYLRDYAGVDDVAMTRLRDNFLK